MNMYVWYSDYFASYMRGRIIVMAKDVASARKKVMQKWVAECYDNYAEDAEWLAEKLAMITKDTAGEPLVVSDNVVFVYGSD